VQAPNKEQQDVERQIELSIALVVVKSALLVRQWVKERNPCTVVFFHLFPEIC
jgi:hypothetical protein